MSAAEDLALTGTLCEMAEGPYHADPALGSTDLKNLLRSPAHYIAAKGVAESVERTAKTVGRSVHECILEPEEWARRVTAPNFNRRTKAGKAEAAEWAARLEAHGLQDVAPDDRELCEAMRDSVMNNRLVRAVLEKATEREISCFWASEGVHCKARFDAFAPGLIVDLKTTRDAQAVAFRNAVARYRYHVQAAHYSSGAYAATGVWPDYAIVAVEKTPPFACAVYMLDEEALSTGVLLRDRALSAYRQCVESGDWPAYEEVAQVLTLPRWAAEEY